MELQGKLHLIGDVVDVNDSFKKRNLVLVNEKKVNDNEWQEYASFELHNDNVALADDFKKGEMVKVHFNIQAREHNGNWYNTLRVWKLEKV